MVLPAQNNQPAIESPAPKIGEKETVSSIGGSSEESTSSIGIAPKETTPIATLSSLGTNTEIPQSTDSGSNSTLNTAVDKRTGDIPKGVALNTTQKESSEADELEDNFIKKVTSIHD